MPLPVSAAATAAGYNAAASGASVSRPDQMNQDTFLKLLVAQLRFQDPSKPADPAQFISQSATFTQVSKTDELIKAVTSNALSQRAMSAGVLVGQQATFTGEDGKPVTGVITSVSLTDTDPVATINGQPIPISRLTNLAVHPTA
jgi:flagellar basal-body rod modification protein FlgD